MNSTEYLNGILIQSNTTKIVTKQIVSINSTVTEQVYIAFNISSMGSEEDGFHLLEFDQFALLEMVQHVSQVTEIKNETITNVTMVSPYCGPCEPYFCDIQECSLEHPFACTYGIASFGCNNNREFWPTRPDCTGCCDIRTCSKSRYSLPRSYNPLEWHTVTRNVTREHIISSTTEVKNITDYKLSLNLEFILNGFAWNQSYENSIFGFRFSFDSSMPLNQSLSTDRMKIGDAFFDIRSKESPIPVQLFRSPQTGSNWILYAQFQELLHKTQLSLSSSIYLIHNETQEISDRETQSDSWSLATLVIPDPVSFLTVIMIVSVVLGGLLILVVFCYNQKRGYHDLD
jgi:hypothetical protein